MKGKQPPYELIDNLRPIKLEELKTYIETQIKTWFIRLSKSLARVPILIYKKSDCNLWLYINYQGLNHLTIKN